MLKSLREERHLTQQQLADLAGIPLRQEQKYEYGEIKPENMALKTALALAKALKVEPKELIE